MNECGQKRVEITGRGKADADGIDDHRAVEILQDDAAAASCHANGFNELNEVVADQHHIRTSTGDICSRTHGYAYRGGRMGIGCRLRGVKTATLAQEVAHSGDVWKGMRYLQRRFS